MTHKHRALSTEGGIKALIIGWCCTNDAKIGEFFYAGFYTSAYLERNKKNLKNFDFSAQLFAYLIDFFL